MSNQFFFSLAAILPQTNAPAGSLTSVTSKETPGLVNCSFACLRLKQRGALLPIWHPNANKLGICEEGHVLVSIRSTGKSDTFTVKKGEIFFVPQGFVHHIENLHENESVIQFTLNHCSPETMYLSKALYSIGEQVFTSTFNTKPQFFDRLKTSRNEEAIKTLPPLKKVPTEKKSLYKFDLQTSKKEILTKGGYLQKGTKTNLSTLQGLSLLGFGLNSGGSVEPHWHTNAGELIYIVKGKTKVTVLSPDGKGTVLEISGGQGAFVPASHFHMIENIGSDEVEVSAFFSHHEPDYIGIGEMIGSYSNELLTSFFNTGPNIWDEVKKIEKPLVIVPV